MGTKLQPGTFDCYSIAIAGLIAFFAGAFLAGAFIVHAG